MLLTNAILITNGYEINSIKQPIIKQFYHRCSLCTWVSIAACVFCRNVWKYFGKAVIKIGYFSQNSVRSEPQTCHSAQFLRVIPLSLSFKAYLFINIHWFVYFIYLVVDLGIISKAMLDSKWLGCWWVGNIWNLEIQCCSLILLNIFLIAIYPKSPLGTCNECTVCWINCLVSSWLAFCIPVSSQCYGKHLSCVVALPSDWKDK